MPEGLSDLDELVLTCRSAAAREYIAEAVASYKGGAYRSAIVATWIAVLFDFLQKLRELEMTGDTNARTKLELFEKAREANDIKRLLEFERNVIDYAQKDFELLSAVEALDLQRLLEDRNRCAHPSMSSSLEPYQPTAELARNHIKNAVNHLFRHPPVQGKSAFDGIVADIKSEYFPIESAKAIEFFKTGPLARARRPLVRNLVLALSKELLHQGWKSAERRRRFAALSAVLSMYSEVGEIILKDSLPGIVAKVSDETFYRVIFYAASIEQAWDFIGTAAKIKAVNYVREVSDEEDLNKFLPYAIRVPALREIARTRLVDASVKTLSKVIIASPLTEYIDLTLTRFENASSFRQAEALCELLVLPLAPVLGEKDINRIANAFLKNGQITYAVGIPDLLLQLFKQTEPLANKAKSSWKSIFAKMEAEKDSFSKGEALVAEIRAKYGL